MNLEKINDAYDLVRDSVLFQMIDGEIIDAIRRGMEDLLPEYKIKCDEENNPPLVIDNGNIIVRVSDPKTMNYINLTF